MARRRIPQEVESKIRQCLIDYVGVTAAGAYEAYNQLVGVADSFLGTQGNSTLIGLGKRTSILTAALINGTAAHTLELDDGHRFGMVHAGTPVITAALLAAEITPNSAERFIPAVACGYEAAIRLARAIQPSHKMKFFHATGTCGTVGAAVAAAVVLGLSNQQLKETVSAAATGASGILEVIGSGLKSFNAGKASAAGLAAAAWAQAGFYGPDDMLGGPQGFLAAYSDRHNASDIAWDGEHYSINDIYIKVYAACRHCHPAIEAALFLKDTYAFATEAVEKIEVSTYDLAIRGHCQKDIPDAQTAMMSIPFAVATALVNQKATEAQFSGRYLREAQTERLTQMVGVHEDKAFSAAVPSKRSARVQLTLASGQTLTHQVDFPKGEPENPVSGAELLAKCDHLLLRAGLHDRAQAIYAQISRLDDITALMDLLQ